MTQVNWYMEGKRAAKVYRERGYRGQSGMETALSVAINRRQTKFRNFNDMDNFGLGFALAFQELARN